MTTVTNVTWQVRVSFADNQTLTPLPESSMFAQVLARCGNIADNIAEGTRVRVKRTLVASVKRCNFCNAEMPDVSTVCMLCGQAAH